MKYKGPGKHPLEELEQIIDNILDDYHDKDKNLSLKLFSRENLIREIYQSLLQPGKLSSKNIVLNLRLYLEDYAKNNNLNLFK